MPEPDAADDALGTQIAEIPLLRLWLPLTIGAMLVQTAAMLAGIVVALFGNWQVAGVLLGIAVVAMVIRMVQVRRRGLLRVYERGVELRDGANVRRYSYEDMVTLSHAVLLTSDGRKQRLVAAAKHTLEPFVRRLVEAAGERLARGETVVTDKLAIRIDTLEGQKQLVRWESVGVKGDDELLIFTRPGLFVVSKYDVPAFPLVRERLAAHGIAIVPQR